MRHDEYTIGWICALPLEQTVAMHMLDERHRDLHNPANDENTYTLGKIGAHNVVIVGLPMGRIGTNDSAAVITRMASTFPNIKFGMMVGVGGGIPNKTRLGDVVICSALGTNAGVVQHDMGKAHAGGQFETRGYLCGPPTAVLTALTKFQADPRTRREMRSHLKKLTAMSDIDESYLKPDSLEDLLFESDYSHANMRKDCSDCDKSRIIQREPRLVDFKIHYGLIASGNTIVKDAKVRDKLCKRYNDNLFCIEMEAAGLMNNFPCVVIRGICDYADSHANDKWQNYAAAVAAACTKALLGVVPEREVRGLQSIQDSITSSSVRASKEYNLQHQAANSPPLTPKKPQGATEPAPQIIGCPEAIWYNNSPDAAHPKLGETLYDANDLTRPQTPPQSPKLENHEKQPHPDDGPSLPRRNTDFGSTQPLLSGDVSAPLTILQKKRSNTFPNTDPAVFFDAIEEGDITTIKRELKNGTNVEIIDEFGRTPLWRAVEIGNRHVIQLLLDNDANVEAKNLRGGNILDWALKKGKEDIVNMVLAKMDAKVKA